MGLEATPDDFQRIWLPYALEHLREWPDATRAAPLDSRIRRALMGDVPCPVLQMVTRLVSPEMIDSDAWLRAILAEDQLRNVRILELDARGGRVLRSHDIEKLARWPGLKRLRSLALIGHGLTDDDLAPLLESPSLNALTQLNLNGNRLTSATLLRLAERSPVMPLRELHFEQAAVTLSTLERLLDSPQGESLEALYVEQLPASFLMRLQQRRRRSWRGLGLLEVEPQEPGALVASGALQALEEVCIQVEGSWDAWPVLEQAATPRMRRLEVSCNTVGEVVVDPGMWERWIGASQVDERLAELAFEAGPIGLADPRSVFEALASWVRLYPAPAVLQVDDMDISPPWSVRRRGHRLLVMQWQALDEAHLIDSARRQVYVGCQGGFVSPGLYNVLDEVGELRWSSPHIKAENLGSLLNAPLWARLRTLTLVSTTGDPIDEDAWSMLLRWLPRSNVRHVTFQGFRWPVGRLEQLVPVCAGLESLELHLGRFWQPHLFTSLFESLRSSNLKRLGLCGIPQSISPDPTTLALPQLAILDLSGRCWSPRALERFAERLPTGCELHLSLSCYQERLEWADEAEARLPVVWSEHVRS